MRAKHARPPAGWEHFLPFLSINKSIPRTLMSSLTADDINKYEDAKIVPVKIPTVRYKTLYSTHLNLSK